MRCCKSFKIMDIAKYTPRKITILLAKLLKRLMHTNYKNDIILYQELKEFVEYNDK